MTECKANEILSRKCDAESTCSGSLFRLKKFPNEKCCRCKPNYKRHFGVCIPENRCPLSKFQFLNLRITF